MLVVNFANASDKKEHDFGGIVCLGSAANKKNA